MFKHVNRFCTCSGNDHLFQEEGIITVFKDFDKCQPVKELIKEFTENLPIQSNLKAFCTFRIKIIRERIESPL